MTRLTAQFVGSAGLFLALAILFISPGGLGRQAVAGEAIVFGKEKIKAEPGKEKAPTQGPFRLEKLTTPPPFDLNTLSPSVIPRPNSSHRKDKRQQNAEDEKKNWLLLDQGELQDKDDEKNFLGVRDDGLDDLDKSKDSHDYTFRPNSSSRNANQLRAPGQSQARLPSQRQKEDANRPPPPRQDADADADNKRASGSTAIVFGGRDAAIDSRIGGESGLGALLDSKAGGRSSGKSVLSLGDFLRNSDNERSREQQIRTDNFKNRILGNGSSSSGISDPVNTHPDFTRQPLNPVMPSGFGDSGPKSFSASPGFAPRQNVAQPNSPMNFLGSPDLPVGSASLGPPQPAPGTWRSTPVDWQRPRF